MLATWRQHINRIDTITITATVRIMPGTRAPLAGDPRMGDMCTSDASSMARIFRKEQAICLGMGSVSGDLT